MKGDPEREGSRAPGEADVVFRLREDIGSWNPRHRPDFRDLVARASAGVNLWVFYPAASAALILILLGAFIVMTTLHIGSLGGQPVHAQLGR